MNKKVAHFFSQKFIVEKDQIKRDKKRNGKVRERDKYLFDSKYMLESNKLPFIGRKRER